MTRSVLVVLTGIMVAVVAFPSQAEAKGLIIYHNGEEAFETGALPAPYDQAEELQGANAGYLCRVFGLFWAHFYKWNCRPVAIKGDTVYTDEKLSAAVGAAYSPGDMKMGFWPGYGRWVMLGLLIAVIGFGVIGKRREEEEEQAVAEANSPAE